MSGILARQQDSAWCLPIAVALVASAHGQELRPQESVVDYLVSIGKPHAFEARKEMFLERFPGENYTGTANQNTRLLVTLVAENNDAKASANESRELVVEHLSTTPEVVSKSCACPGWVPAEGVGFNGSYGITLNAKVANGKVRDRDFAVAIRSAAGHVGTLQLLGTIEVYVNNSTEPSQEIPLQPAYFDTIGPDDPSYAFRYAKEGNDIIVPSDADVKVVVHAKPMLTTSSGSVALWPCTLEVMLQEN